jgi:Tol biopolymer transport system component/predicted component of type VI protein secretion system
MTEAKTIGWLEGLTGSVKGLRVEMKGDSFLIGRGTTADIQLQDSLVSREHARVSYNGKQLMLEDLDSKYGTFLNGDPVKTATLKNGDRIRFGGSLFHLHVPKSLSLEDEPGQDDIATVMASEDEIATELASHDQIAAALGDAAEPMEEKTSVDLEDHCAHCGAPLKPDEKFCGECGTPRSVEEPAATVLADPVEPPPVTPPPPARPPAIAPPAAPSPSSTKQKGIPGWLIIVLAGVATVVILGLALFLAFNFLSADREQPPELSLDLGVTQEVLDRADQPTTTPIPEAETQVETEAAAAALGTEQPVPTITTVTSTASMQTEASPSTEPTEAPAASAAVGGAMGIAFASDRTGYPQVYYLDLVSGEVAQLTDISNGACQPAWSPDGAQLAYTSPCGSNREAYVGSSIFIMDVDEAGNPGTTQALMISLGGDYDPDWSPDGAKIAFTTQRTGRPQVFTVGLDGQAPFNVNDDLAHNWSPSWSPDELQLAFLTGRGGAEEIWLVPADGGEEQRFSRSEGEAVAKPDWSPDGNTILFEKVIGNIPRVVAAPVADSGVRVVQVCQEGTHSLQPMSEPTWSPDGTWIAFETWPGGGDHKIAVMQLNCSGYEELTEDPALEFDAAWRPAP